MTYLSKFLEQFQEKKTILEPIEVGMTIMTFGKHKGRFYKEIYESDKQKRKCVRCCKC